MSKAPSKPGAQISAAAIASTLLVAAALLLLVPVESRGQSKDKDALEPVLNQMDKAAANFHTTEARFEWDQYTAVVKETDTQKGKVYFRRTGNETQMAADVTSPASKYVLFSGGKVQIYQPSTDQVTVYSTGKNRAEVESFLVLGFGGGGHAMLSSFEVKDAGSEDLNGISTAKLDLTPKSEKIRNTFTHIVLWIDPARGISLQQQLFQPEGDYRLNRYSDIRVNGKIPESAFRLKTDSKTVVQNMSSD